MSSSSDTMRTIEENYVTNRQEETGYNSPATPDGQHVTWEEIQAAMACNSVVGMHGDCHW